MEAAKRMDELSTPMESSRAARSKDERPGSRILVTFVVLDKPCHWDSSHSTVIQQMLRPTWDVSEALWNFNRLEYDKRITLQQNPHFYTQHPMMPSDAHGGEFEAFPLERFHMGNETETIYILVDQPSRVFLETEQETRIFGNVVIMWDAIVFKGLSEFLPYLVSILTSY
ncbi:hypothetical protein BJV78DRAFT_417285 [Lactifluus subvellereus]|nr:hypothetical protein BJV78DRAFT_417285 [Lactifluus subvellereus]